MLTAEAARERLQNLRIDILRLMDAISRVNVSVSVARKATPEDAARHLHEAELAGGTVRDDSLELYKKVLMLHGDLMPERQTALL